MFVAILLTNGAPAEEGPQAVALGTTREDAIACLHDEALAIAGDEDGDFEQLWAVVVAEEQERPRYSQSEHSMHVHEVR